MNVKLLTEYHLEFLSLGGGCTGSSCQNATLLEITFHCSYIIAPYKMQSLTLPEGALGVYLTSSYLA